MALFLKAGLSPPLDRTLVVRAVSCVQVLGKQKAELALTAVAVTFLALESSLASLDPVISQGLQLFRGQHLCAAG